jgi:two-component system sensor kinase FixL
MENELMQSHHRLPYPRFLLEIILFACIYVTLDAASFIDPLHGLNITPWNPAPALSLVLLLRRGRTAWVPVIAVVILSECVVRGLSDAWWASVLSAFILAAGYILLSELLRPRIAISGLLGDRRALFQWLWPVAIGSLAISIIYLSSLRLFGLLPPGGLQIGILQFWIGDAVGITVAMPLFLWLSSERGRVLLKVAAIRWETLGYIVLSALVVWLAFGLGDNGGFKLFYLLFLPIVWASTRQGMAGAIISASILQISVITAVQFFSTNEIVIYEIQLLSLVMALIGFFIGCVVDEQSRTSNDLKHTLRLAAAGEMAGALAHELNQPLTALSAYASACEALIDRGETGERLNAAIHGMLTESARTGDVVRRLRDFFRTGATKLEVVDLRELIADVVPYYQEKTSHQNMALIIGVTPKIGLLADKLQIELVLRNLLANAIDAVNSSDESQRRISLDTEVLTGSRIMITVKDSGKGLSPEKAALLFEPFQSSKSSGLGLGLVISKAIVETHGGSLWGEVSDHGIFKCILPSYDNALNE